MGNLTSNQIGGIVLIVAVTAVVVVGLLSTRNKNNSSSPAYTPGMTPGMTPTYTPGMTPGMTPTYTPGMNPDGPSSRPPGGLTQFFYDGNTGKVLSQDNPCYTCSKKANPCGCYLNRNCSASPDGFVIPDICNGIPCLKYETQDENGGEGTCNQAGLDLYRNAINSDVNSIHSYLCNTSADKATNCKTQCKQNDGPFSSLPFCTGCCEQACATIDCSTYGPSPARTTPAGTTAPCDICKTVCAMSPDYCDRCKDENGC